MTSEQWEGFCRFREDFRRQCEAWNEEFGSALQPLQVEAGRKDTPEYPVETGVVYNRSLDEVTADSEIKLIVIGDNPGKDEQRAANRRYLVGQAGKIAAGFFARNPALGVDFRKNTIILNKTPVHTAKTTHLRYVLKNGGSEIRNLIEESQRWMAARTAALHQILGGDWNGGRSGLRNADITERTVGQREENSSCQLWLVGYAELKGRRLFLGYRDELAQSYRCTSCPEAGDETETEKSAVWNQVMVYQHFSMNRFTIDLAECIAAGKIDGKLPLYEQLAALGELHRKEIFGC